MDESKTLETPRDDTLSALHHALRATRRRDVITLLTNPPDLPVTVRETAKAIAAKEEGVSHDQATGEPYRNAYNALAQTHLPTLADAGIIIYDSNRQTIVPGERIVIASLMVAVGPPVVDTLLSSLDSDSDQLLNSITN